MSRKPKALLVMNQGTFADQFDSLRLDRLAGLVDLGEAPWTDSLNNPAITGHLADVEILLTSWGVPRLDAPALARMPNLRAVFHCAGTVRSFVTPELWNRGIVVTNGADANAIPVAEFTFASIVLAGKKAHVLANDARIHREDWGYATSRGELGNIGRVIGVIGFSRIGRRVVRLVQQLQDVTCLVSDPHADSAAVADAGGKLVSLQELLESSDIVTVHAPALPETRHMIGSAELQAMKDHATLINTARGSLVDTKALEAECATGRIQALLDVTEPEPLPADSILYDLPNVEITPHIAGSLGTETRRMSDAALNDLERYLTGQQLAAQVVSADLSLSA
ncbi:phosphoglycerate dehydrogenase-like enzyme [Arthrobacter sp. AG258]|uniref:hydroxyacid dehydrogenase n=1 Tax=Arthrobacter sp. AG258 TaxID=2183899 RepID=UPI0010604E56|nr:hydroxyacid dehydrogenase [Arthrobacter sp. AG258]TDT80133.1 phosphoglycerate dehydrogenase-like enzyme [Arthrobacter sp. AG258]